MGKQATDVLQIQKYLNGELDARAMHQLEREAQDDPFLMDAMEGYQNAKSDQRANLTDLMSRLDSRVSEKKSRIIPLRIISIAASVLLICGAGLWWLKQKPAVIKQPSKMQAAVATVTAPSKTIKQEQEKPAEHTIAAAATKKPAQRVVTSEETAAAAAETQPAIAEIQVAPPSVEADTKIQRAVAKDTTPLNEMIVMGYTGLKKKDTTAHLRLREIRVDTAPQQMLEAKVAGVKVYPKTQSAADLTKLMTQGNLGNIAINQLTTNPALRGKTIEQYKNEQVDMSPVIPGGTNQAAKPDAKRYFKLNPDTSPNSLAANARSFQARRAGVNSNARDSVKAKADAADKSDGLSETIVTGYTSHSQRMQTPHT